MPDEIEIITVEITSQKQIHILCLVYRPPSINDIYNRKIVDYIQSFSYTSNITILGDLNLPDMC